MPGYHELLHGHSHGVLRSRRSAKSYLQHLVKGAMLDSPSVAKLAWIPQCYTTESAYSHAGPRQQKRGFDSLGQSVSGIVHEEIAGAT
jgi:hypothetical protein